MKKRRKRKVVHIKEINQEDASVPANSLSRLPMSTMCRQLQVSQQP